MNWTLHILKSPRVIRVKMRGRYDPGEMKRLIDVVGDKIDDLTYSPLLFDGRELEGEDVTPMDVLEMSNKFSSKRSVLGCRKIALITAKPPRTSLASRFKNAAQPGSPTHIDVFQDEEEALSWLSDSG